MPYFVAALLGALVGLGAYTFRYAEGLSYFSTDPRACVNCHIMREPYDSWQKASHHAAATCVECHLPTAFVAVQAATARGVSPEALGDAPAFHRRAIACEPALERTS